MHTVHFRRYFSFLLFFALLAGAASSAEGASPGRRARTVDDVRRSACRVGVSNARGSGMIVGYDEAREKFIVVSNYHVVGQEGRCSCEWWDNFGRRFKTTGEVVWRAHDQQKPYDFALIAVDRSFVESHDLPYVPLAGADYEGRAGMALDSAGCPRAQFVVGWDGGVLSEKEVGEFIPGPYPGQSGSGIVAFVDGLPWYTGTLTWLVGAEGSDDSKGAYIPVRNLWRALDARRRTSAADAWRAPADYHECPVIGSF